MAERYKAVPGSNTGQCFFEASVLDLTRPDLDGDGNQMMLGENDDEPQWIAVCECRDMETAEMIAAALNASETALQFTPPKPEPFDPNREITISWAISEWLQSDTPPPTTPARNLRLISRE